MLQANSAGKSSPPKLAWRRATVVVLGVTLWFVPPPDGLSTPAWHLFAIFLATIASVILGALPVLVASILALVVAVLSGTVEPAAAYSGFSQDFILLIVVAFLMARAVVKSGLGQRIAFHLIRRFGRTPLGLAYSMAITDALIAPAFPSNTARSGVLYPVTLALCLGQDSRPDDDSRTRLGTYLMMNGIAGLTISSGLWLTAMAANPVGARLAQGHGVEITFWSWTLAALVPSVVALAVLPWLLLRVQPPGLRHTPDAPAAAAAELRRLGSMSRAEWITAVTFAAVILGYGLATPLNLDKTAVAFGGLAVLMISGLFTAKDLAQQGEALGTFLWFAILYALSAALDDMGFMSYVGAGIASQIQGLPWPLVHVTLISLYVVLHYLFVSQTAHLLALYGVFLGVAVQAGVPPALAAYSLLFATNYFAAVTPQASSANVLFAGSGYLDARRIYLSGAAITLTNLLIFLALGTPWILLVTR